ncbi:TonB-dependent receptor domain-containing protein [Rheinheimera pacifica]|uniref:TonB-dependent receptor domain-containing protein n=1 Tax=Rheinheimera pacifica TaxID=173990 RepID=UPI002ED87685
MYTNNKLTKAVRLAIAFGAASAATSAFNVVAQDTTEAQKVERISVTGSRIMRADLVSNSPIHTVDAEELNARADITIDTYLNTLPQVNPAGGTTSNNPGNSGQSNVNLRGLGSNRNLVLVDGRRVMVSQANMTVDLNTIPAAMIEGIEVITGGAGAAYGADAVSGAVNLKLKRNFEGFDFRATHSNHDKNRDARENGFSAVLGSNFEGGKGNAIIAFDYSERQELIKAQRPFAAMATSTTTFFPEGLYFSPGNSPTQAAVDAVFAGYGVPAGSVPANANLIGFNSDGSLYSRGVPRNENINVENWRYPVDLSVNQKFFPDFYSYNFDEVNLLVLPLERKTFSSKFDYDLSDSLRVFASVSWTNYESQTALAPTPFPTVNSQSLTGTNPQTVKTGLITPGTTIAGNLVVPVTNPFISNDFRTILNSRTGDNAGLVGSGADEPFQIRSRSLWGGLRSSIQDNTVVQYMMGFSGDIGADWTWDAYAMEGKTTISTAQTGNLNTQRIQELLEAPDGGASRCEGGYNPFGRQPVSQACIDYVSIDNTTVNELNQRIWQAYVSGDAFELPAGMLSTVFGIESRKFEYDFNPGALSGPVSGLNAAAPAGGNNNFFDVFAEAFIPVLEGVAFADSLDLSLGFRISESEFEDTVKNIKSKKDRNNAFKAELSWVITSELPRIRTSFQKAVRAPNFGELFNQSLSAPQYFDPCSVGTDFRNSTGAAGAELCQATGVNNTSVYVQSPGSQTRTDLTGNTELGPEKANTFTLGAVQTFDSGLVIAVDYYNIDIEDAIISPNPQLVIADCYNYYGNNPNLSADYAPCRALVRGGGGDVTQVNNPVTQEGTTPTINGGYIKTSGIDVQAAWSFEPAWLQGNRLKMDLYVNHLLGYETQQRDYLPVVKYEGTVAYFGAGLGESFPEWKANLNTRLTLGDFDIALRGRYIHGMDNRLNPEFPLETSPQGVGSVTYWDSSVTYNIGTNYSFRLGLNNMFDKTPPVYSPNVQSGTDPSLYDVVGRRYTLSANIKF